MEHFVQAGAEKGPHVPLLRQAGPAYLVNLQGGRQVRAHVHFGRIRIHTRRPRARNVGLAYRDAHHKMADCSGTAP